MHSNFFSLYTTLRWWAYLFFLFFLKKKGMNVDYVHDENRKLCVLLDTMMGGLLAGSSVAPLS
jgi:hypothetical protein